MYSQLPLASQAFLFVYTGILFILMAYGVHRYWILFLYWRHHKKSGLKSAKIYWPAAWKPVVTVQLPLYNEMYVAERLIEAVCELDYPKADLEIQVLDDSTDGTVDLVSVLVAKKRALGFDIKHVRRSNREGFKAGALAYGLTQSRGEFVAIFDADFIPPPGFLKATLPHFQKKSVGMVQTRWGHINANYSMLTRLQALFLDGHFLLEHTARYASGAFFNFNGTAGVWRRKAIDTAGGWSARSLTEDLDLSYRAQLAGWKFVYDPSFVCPAELPVDIHSFRSQQRRWTKGALQVARVLLMDLWRARLPFHTKIEATVHLTGNLGYLLTVLVALMLLPSLIIRQQLSWFALGAAEAVAFITTTVSVTSFYVVSQRELYPDWKVKIRDIPVLLSFGIGMCLSNAAAVLEGLAGLQSDFVRTPKYNIKTKQDTWRKKSYVNKRGGSLAVQFFFMIYSAVTFSVALDLNYWGALPFILLFVFGFGYVALLGAFQRRA